MEHHHIRLQRYLECYGSDMESWPPEARLWAADARKDSAFNAMIEDEKKFESLLRADHFVPARSDLANRIVTASRTTGSTRAMTGEIAVALHSMPAYMTSYFRPTALATMLVLGFVIGFNAFHSPMNEGTVSMQSYTDDEGAIL